MSARRPRRRSSAVDPYAHLVKQLDELKVSKLKQAETMHDHRTIRALGDDMSWLKKRKQKPYLKVKHKAIHLKHLRIWFDSYDQDKSGSISVSELAWPMLVLGYANTIDEVHKLLHEVDANNDGTLSFDEFVDLLSQNDAKHDVHPLEKLVQMAQHGVMGDAALSLQTLIPSYQRKLMLESLMAYGDTTHSPRNRRELQVREANEAMLRRADIALHALDHGGAALAAPKPSRLPPMKDISRAKKGAVEPATRILHAGSNLRRILATTESSPALFYGTWHRGIIASS